MRRRTNVIIMWILGIIIVAAIVTLGVMMYLDSKKYLPSENITVMSTGHMSGNEYEKIEKVVVETIGIPVGGYSFDGGINWQTENEYYANESETLIIVVRDINGKLSEPIEYKVKNVDSTPPVIKVNLPKTVLLNSKINLGEYVSVTDENSGVDGSITMTPSSLDTSKLGKKTIKFSAVDKAGNIASIDVVIEVVSQNDYAGSDTKVLYRYRVKNVTEYDCNSHDCSYYEDTEVLPSGSMYSSKSCRATNEKISFNNGCYIQPNGIETSSCSSKPAVTVDRYSEYKTDDGWTYIIDIYALGVNGSQITDFDSISASQSAPTLNGTYETTGSSVSGVGGGSSTSNEAIDGYDAMINMLKTKYKYEPCDKGEISINGFCHLICSGRKDVSCGDGLTLIDNQCKKLVKKTCTDKCTKNTWSNWSEWSESPIASTDFVQVETKVVK